MMLTKFFLKFTHRRRKIGSRDEAIPRSYSPDQGLPMVAVDKLLDTYNDYLRLLRNELPVSDQQYDALVLPTIRRYAAFAHLIPASQSHHHDWPGGLLVHSLEVAQFCARQVRGSVWDHDQYPERRYRRQPVWILAAAIGGLLHDAGKLLTDVSVARGQDAPWNPTAGSLIEWAAGAVGDRYLIEWLPGRHERHVASWAAIGPKIIDDGFGSWLGHQDYRDIQEAFFGALTGNGPSNNQLAKIICHADSLSTAKALREGRATRTDRIFAPAGPQFVSALASMISNGALPWNRISHPLWYLRVQHDLEVYGVWPSICERVAANLREKGFTSLPSEPADLLEKLLERGLIIPGPDGCSTTLLQVDAIRKPLQFVRFDIDRIGEIVRGRIALPVPDTAISAAVVAVDHHGSPELPFIDDEGGDLRTAIRAILRGEKHGLEHKNHALDVGPLEFDELAKEIGLAKGELYKRLQETSQLEISRLANGFLRIGLRPR